MQGLNSPNKAVIMEVILCVKSCDMLHLIQPNVFTG